MPVIQTTPKISCHHRDAASANACGDRIRAGLLDRFWQCDECYWEEQEAPQKAQQEAQQVKQSKTLMQAPARGARVCEQLRQTR